MKCAQLAYTNLLIMMCNSKFNDGIYESISASASSSVSVFVYLHIVYMAPHIVYACLCLEP